MKLYYRDLDGLRVISAVIIVLFHCHLFLHIPYLQPYGALVTDIFFMLSSFGLSLKYATQPKTPLPAGRFLMQRAVKLLPVYWMALLACIMVISLTIPSAISPGRVLRAILLLPGIARGEAFPLDPPAWFLFSLCLSYIVFACGLYKAPLRMHGLIALAGWLLYFRFSEWSSGTEIAIWGTIRALADFSAGVILYRKHDSLIQHLPRISPLIPYGLTVVLTALPFSHIDAVYSPTFTIFICPLIILLTLRADRHIAPRHYGAGWKKRLFALPYPLFISHYAAIFTAICLGISPTPARVIFVLSSAILLAAIIAALNFPMQRYLHRHLRLEDTAYTQPPIQTADNKKGRQKAA